MPVENPIPQDYIAQNQEFWRKAKRGILSRPVELPRIGHLVHKRMQKTFSDYGLQDAVKPILTSSILIDNPKTASSKFNYAERIPEDIAEEDKQDFLIGISRINEYATNYAAKEFFTKNPDLPVFKQAAKIYSGVSNLVTYGILLNGTFSRMRDIEIMANHNKKDYKGALLTALFQHDTAPINEIIAMTSDYTGYSDINGLAIEIGRKRYRKPDVAKWLDNLDANRNDGKIKTAVKNGVLSTAALGIFRNPGVIESTAGIIPASPLISGIGTFALIESIFLTNHVLIAVDHPEHVEMILQKIPSMVPESAASIVAATLFVAPFVIAHEAVHYYSADEKHMGLIPVNLISKEVTPYKARLETE